jgi:hypothetical protein
LENSLERISPLIRKGKGKTIGDILGFVGSIVSSQISSKAQKQIAAKQIAALERQRQFVYDQLDPKRLQEAALKGDTESVKNRLELMKKTNPDLFKAQFGAQAGIAEAVDQLRTGGPSGQVEAQATKEALAGNDVAGQAKQKLIDAALEELNAGATLPPDVQAELVKAGLEKSGMVTGVSGPRGVGGNITRELVGTGALQLKQQRQQAASALLGRAQDLETQRASLLGTLFPNLATTQLNRLKGLEGAAAFSNEMVPNAGLSGKDIVNLWLARVGANSSLESQKTQAGYLGGVNSAAALQQGYGAATSYAANALPTTASFFKNANTSANEQAFNDQFG